MKIILPIALLSVLCAHAQTSNVETVRAWRRTHVMGLPGGTLRDPTASIADGQRQAAATASIAESSNIVAAAGVGLTNALERLWSVADQTNRFTGRLYIAADMDDDPDYENLAAFIVGESAETNVIHYYTHYSRVLSEPPRTLWSFNPAPGLVYWAPGIIDTNAPMTNVSGYACYDISVQRPDEIGAIILRAHKFLKWGTPAVPFDIPDAGLEIVANGATNLAFTGEVTFTNAQVETIETYLSGFLYHTVTNQLEGTP